MWSKYPDINEELRLVENYIKKNIVSRNKLLMNIANELIDAGGKRLRPAFVILASKFGSYNRKKVLPAAGALEILHTATLVHDDIIDHSKLRRGRLTVSEKYGSDMAIYSGDFLFTKAVLMLSKGFSSDKLDLMAKAIKIICEGEVDQYEDRYNINTSVPSYLKRINRKTAVLFSTASALGAHVGKCPAGVARKLYKVGFYYGMAFQIRDDLKDFLSDSASEGKPVGNDIAKGIITLPVIYALRRSEELRGIIEEAFASKDRLSDSQIVDISRIVKGCGGIEATEEMLDSYIKKGIKELAGLPENSCKAIFNDLFIALSC